MEEDQNPLGALIPPAPTPLTRSPRRARDTGDREASARQRAWVPPTLLPDPAPHPDWNFRWVRVSTLGKGDASNVSSRMREGWVPVRAADHPEVQIMSDPDGRFPDGIEVGGLVLCKAPKEVTEDRNAHYVAQARGQVDAVDSTMMRVNDPRMPLFKERSTEVSRSRFGKGN